MRKKTVSFEAVAENMKSYKKCRKFNQDFVRKGENKYGGWSISHRIHMTE